MLSTTRAKLTIEVPFSELKPAINKAYRDLSNQVSIPGFRKGHVPPAMIDQRLGRGTVLSEAVNAMLPDIYAEAVDAHELTPLGQPAVEMTKLEDGETAEFTAEVDIVPAFDLPDLASLQVTVDALDDVDAAVDERVHLLQERFAEVAPVERAAAPGDQVHLNLVAARDGEPLEDASADGITYVVGSGGMLEGLDDAITGCVAGDERTFTSTLVGGGREGEAADITVTVTAVEERTLPTIDDEFAGLVSQYDTLDEMKADLRQAVERQAAMGQLSQARDRVIDKLIELTPFDLPEAVVEAEVANRTSGLTEQLAASGLTLADYLARVGDPDTATEEEFWSGTRSAVEKGIRAEILLSRATQTVKVTVDPQDLTNLLFQKAQENGTSPEQELQHMQSHDHMNEWLAQIRQSKVLDQIVAGAQVVDTQGQRIQPVRTPAEDSGHGRH
jgi:trigger factor